MAAGAVEAGQTGIPTRVSSVASLAVHGLVSVPRTATVLGTSDYATWLLVADTVIVLSTRDATRLPNGIEIAAGAHDGLFASLRQGAPAKLGWNRVVFENLIADVARWWDPRPALRPVTPEQLAEATQGLPDTVPDVDASGLRRANAVWSPRALETAAKQLLGKGSGLTPEGDDFLAGMLAALRLFGEVLAHGPALRMIDHSARPLARLAEARTTTFSAALLQYATRGQVAEPAGALLRALAGRGNIDEAHARLEAVGHSSGPALAAGIVLGARSLTYDLLDSDRSPR